MSRHAKTDREKAAAAGLAKPADPERDVAAAEATDIDAEDRAKLIQREEQAKAALAERRREQMAAVERKTAAEGRRDRAVADEARAEATDPATPQSMADAVNARRAREGAEGDIARAEGDIATADLEIKSGEREVEAIRFEIDLAALPAERDALRARLAQGYAALAAELEAFARNARDLASRAPDGLGQRRVREAAGLLAFNEEIEWNPLNVLVAAEVAEARAAAEVAEIMRRSNGPGGPGLALPSPQEEGHGILARAWHAPTEAEQDWAGDLRRAAASRELNEAAKPDRSWDYNPLSYPFSRK